MHFATYEDIRLNLSLSNYVPTAQLRFILQSKLQTTTLVVMCIDELVNVEYQNKLKSMFQKTAKILPDKETKSGPKKRHFKTDYGDLVKTSSASSCYNPCQKRHIANVDQRRENFNYLYCKLSKMVSSHKLEQCTKKGSYQKVNQTAVRSIPLWTA